MIIMVKEKRLITAALPYTNNVPHLGNLAGSHYPADVFARYCRLAGHDTVFIGGTDEHGTASEIAAQKFGITPKELCDFFYKIHKEIYDWFEISYDNFSRTSRPIHHDTSNEFLKIIYKNGYISEKIIKVPFCLNCQRELADRFIGGQCPNCSYDKARGDQCEQCGTMLDSEKLIKPKCLVCDKENIQFNNVKHLFLDLEKLSPKIEKWLKTNKQIRPQVKNLAMGWINEGLKPRCITRNLKWGINVPIKGFEQFVWYVWAEAPIGYISSTKEWNKTKWKNYWLEPKAKIYNFIGKDNIPFHTIFFPGMLLAHKDINLPYNVVGLQYLNYERGKFSKSQNRGIFCENLPKLNLSVDYWRYYLAYLVPETKDTEFLWDDFKDKINSELVGNFGNFVNRNLTFTNKNFSGIVPKPTLNVKDKKFIKEINDQIKVILSQYEKIEIRSSMDEIMKLSAMGNKYFQDNEPWKDLERAKTVIYISVNLSRIVGLLIQPFIPSSSKRLLQMLNVDDNSFKEINKFTIQANHKINLPSLLFNKIEDKDIEELKEKTSKVTEYFLKEEKTMQKKEIKIETKVEHKPIKPIIQFTDFEKLDLRVGKIIRAEAHPNADKLCVLQVDFGDHKRQIVAGIKLHYKLEDLINKKITVVVNLQPTSLRGVESQGMLLAASDKDNVVLITPEKDISKGSRVS